MRFDSIKVSHVHAGACLATTVSRITCTEVSSQLNVVLLVFAVVEVVGIAISVRLNQSDEMQMSEISDASDESNDD